MDYKCAHTLEREPTQAFMLNTVGAATAIRAALPGMTAHYKETGTAASIVLFSSVAVQQGFPNHAIISACKGAWGTVGFASTHTHTCSPPRESINRHTCNPRTACALPHFHVHTQPPLP